MVQSKNIQKYFDSTANREPRDDLKLAVKLIERPKIAVDCGCGAGSDIAYLHSKDYFVHAFDVESEAIARCKNRFSNDKNVLLSQATFNTFEYPSTSLMLADASLFFCPKNEFGEVWNKITQSLLPEGIFVGSFLGPKDSMASTNGKTKAYWPELLVVSEEKVRYWMNDLNIISFTEHRSTGKSFDGEPHQWHVFSVEAQKCIKG